MIPTANRLLVKPYLEEETTKGGIILTSPIDKPVKYADVLQIGPKVSDVRIGDIVVFGKYVAAEANDGLLIIKEDDVLALLNKSDTI